MCDILTTKKDRAIPIREHVPSRPRKSQLTFLTPPGAKAISFRSSDNSLSQFYDRHSEVTYLDQCFEVLSCIGYGCFGVVFKVNSLEDGKLYAIKKSRERFRNALDKKRKLLEVERLEKLPKHPNCVQMHRAWEENGFLFLQLELCGVSLAQYTLGNHNIPEDTIWDVLTDITLALKHLHDRNIMHLDIKLDNILMSPDGSFKLSDFGISLDCSQKFQDFTDGDARYIAPEVLTEKFTNSADIFSLGISLYELSFDVNLPQNGVLWQCLRKGEITQLRIDTISKDLFELIKWMMHPDPDTRPTADMILLHVQVKQILRKRKFLQVMEYLASSGKLILSFLAFFGKVGYNMVKSTVLKLQPHEQDCSTLGKIDDSSEVEEDAPGVVTSTPNANNFSGNSQATPKRLDESWEVGDYFNSSVNISNVSAISVSRSEDFLRNVSPHSVCKQWKSIRVHPYSKLINKKCPHRFKRGCTTVRNLLRDFSE